jgi:hypothetical protein
VILVDLDQNNKIELQHVLVAGGEAQKHWRENWEFEPQYYFEFAGQNTWVKKPVMNSSAGQWVQRTLQVDDSPRYECVSPIVSTLNNTFWECQAWAPLPRRDLTKRHDYNVLDRRNRIQHTATGWLHEEDNTKLLVTGDQRTGIVKEKGENIYTKIDDAACAPAVKYWTQNKYIWDAIRSVWEEFYAERQVLKFDGGGLWMKLFELADVAAEKKLSTAEIKAEARAAILSYLK